MTSVHQTQLPLDAAVALVFMAFIGGFVIALEIATAITRRERVMMARVITIMEIVKTEDGA